VNQHDKETGRSSSEGPRAKAEAFVRNPLNREFKRTLRRDLGDIYWFYVDEDSRARLAKMRRIRRFFVLLWWLLKSLLQKLTPVRRTLLLISLVCFYLGDFRFDGDGWGFRVNSYPFSVLILLWIVLLELKDKLLVREEMEVGRAVQLTLLPQRNPALAGWDIWLMSRPANDVGGDLADYLALEGSRLGLSLGDVAGKGLGAAMLMAKLQATLRAIAPDFLSLAELGARINRIFYRDCGPTRFATLIYAEIAEKSGKMRVLNAGHPQPLVLGTAGVQVLPAVALPIGMMADSVYVEQHIDVEPGGLVLFHSDGLTEAANKEGAFFGDERLREMLPALRGLPAEQVGARIVEEVERFLGEGRPGDDLSMIIMKRLGP
jgi:sigma-B regulation protein RsbU (phosphoserine phosphatase)